MSFTAPNYDEVNRLVTRLHESAWLLYVATTGATGSLVQNLWAAPGSSNTIIGSTFLYDTDQLDQFIGGRPHSGYCSVLTARKMAAEAYAQARRRAEQMPGSTRPVLGLGMTAAVGTTRPKKGEHRVHIAVKTPDRMWETLAEFGKNPKTGFGLLTRRMEGEVCDMLALDSLLIAADQTIPGLNWSCDEIGFPRGHKLEMVKPLDEWINWRNDNLLLWPDDSAEQFSDAIPHGLNPSQHIIFPGSFNPLHHGHENIAELAEAMNPGMKVVYQMTGTHPAKGEIPRSVLMRRAEQLQFRVPTLLMSGNGLYVEKARALPGFKFLIGVDAVLGLLDKKYYGDSLHGLNKTLSEFDKLGTRFLVVGREMDGHYLTLDHIPVPPKYAHLFEAVSGRWDVSSTELRGKR